MNTKNQLLMTHSAIPMALIIFCGSFVLTGWLPPPAPDLSPQEFAQIFNPDNVMLRIGVLLLSFFSILLITYTSVIATQIRRMEGPHHVMSGAMLASQAAGFFLFILPAYLWLAISYRPNLNPETIMVLNDLAWFQFLAGASPTIVVWLCTGIAILNSESEEQVYPRWFAFLNLWLALGAVSGQLIPFVYSGPFGYSGIFGFWVIASCFFIWAGSSYVCTLKAVRAQAAAV